MLLYISGSYPENPEGIAAGAKVLLDAMAEAAGKEKICFVDNKYTCYYRTHTGIFL